MAEDGLQSHLAAVVVVTEVQGQVTRTLEAEVPGQLCFRLRTCRGSGQRILHATTARTQNHMTEFLLYGYRITPTLHIFFVRPLTCCNKDVFERKEEIVGILNHRYV